jgi:hypothetical protein
MEGIKLTLTLILTMISLQSKSHSFISSTPDKPHLFLKSSYFQAGGEGSFYTYANEVYFIPAYTIQHGYNLAISEKTWIGAGIGLTAYEKQSFAPAYLLCQYFISSHTYSMIQGGYAVAWQHNHHNFPDYTLNGGFYAGTGIGYNFKLNDFFRLFVQVSYQYQLAKLSSKYLEHKNVNFNSFALTLGIMIQKK